MLKLSNSPDTMFLALGLAFVLFLAGAATLLTGRSGMTPRRSDDRRWAFQYMENERNMAIDLDLDFQVWIILRIAILGLCLLVGLWSGVFVGEVGVPLFGLVGVPWLFAGRGRKRRLEKARRFVEFLHLIESRVEVANQPLDMALQEVGRRPPKGLEYVLAPLGGTGPIVENLVAAGKRSRSNVIKQAMGELMLSRSRSLDQLLAALKNVIIPNTTLNLTIEEENLTTLAQQRSATVIMWAIIIAMYVACQHASTYYKFYHGMTGQVVLVCIALVMFFAVWVVGKLVRPVESSCWDLDELSKLDEQQGGRHG